MAPRYMSVDVECIATSKRHDARAVCSVAVVDAKENVLLNTKVKPEGRVFSYLTPLTGEKNGFPHLKYTRTISSIA